MKTANVLRFRTRPLPEEEKLVISRGQQQMILENLERCMLQADDAKTAEEFSQIHSMVWLFCKPLEDK